MYLLVTQDGIDTVIQLVNGVDLAGEVVVFLGRFIGTMTKQGRGGPDVLRIPDRHHGGCRVAEAVWADCYTKGLFGVAPDVTSQRMCGERPAAAPGNCSRPKAGSELCFV